MSHLFCYIDELDFLKLKNDDVLEDLATLSQKLQKCKNIRLPASFVDGLIKEEKLHEFAENADFRFFSNELADFLKKTKIFSQTKFAKIS